MINRWTIPALLAVMLIAGTLSTVAQQTYQNDFTSEALPFEETQGDGAWNLDTSEGVLNFSQSGGTHASWTTVQLSGWDANDFVVSTRFTVNASGGGAPPSTSGFGLFSESSTLDSGVADYYLLDWQLGGGGNARLRIIAFQSGTTILGETNVGKAVEGETYELRATGVYNGGELELTLALFDVEGEEIGSITRTHATPITGNWFGLRNRTANNTIDNPHVLDLDYHEFSVRTPPAVRISDLAPSDGATFHPAAEGLRFTVRTGVDRTVDPADVVLILNGQEVPNNELVITGSSPELDVFYDGLEPGFFYTAEAFAADDLDETSRTWSFDTLDEETTVVIEAEDYNFAADVDCDPFSGQPGTTPVAGGSYINDPVPSAFISNMHVNRDENGTPVGYVDRVGAPGIDFHNTTTQAGDVENNEYRFCDPVGTEGTTDVRRQKYIDASMAYDFTEDSIPDYHVHQVQTGEWLNYTRDFPEGAYQVLLRAAASGSPVMRLDRVTSDPSVGDQETQTLGHFAPSATGGGFAYTPLTDSAGVQTVIVSLSGEETLRLTAESGVDNNINLNFLAFVPVETVPPSVASVSPAPQAGDVSPAAAIEAELIAGSAPLDVAGIRLFVNGEEVAADVAETAEGAVVSYTPGNLRALGNTARVDFDDLDGAGPYSFEWSFSVRLEGTQEVYANDFSSEALPEMDGPWTLDPVNQVLNYFREGGIFAGTAALQLPGWNADFIVSTRFTVNTQEGTGNVILSGIGALSEASTLTSGHGDYYLADWELGGGGNSRLRLHAFVGGSANALGTSANLGKAVPGETYELRLTGVYRGDALHLRLALYDESGSEIGAVEGAHTNPIGGNWFGLRNRTHSATGHVLDLDYHEFSVAAIPPDVQLPTPAIAWDGAQILVTWDDPNAQLETAIDLSGPWTVVEGAASPYIVDPVNPRQFFRLRVE